MSAATKNPDSVAPLVGDTELSQRLGGALSPSFLRKDRLGKQRIPFYRVGDRCLYDPVEVAAAIRKNRFGGKAT